MSAPAAGIGGQLAGHHVRIGSDFVVVVRGGGGERGLPAVRGRGLIELVQAPPEVVAALG